MLQKRYERHLRIVMLSDSYLRDCAKYAGSLYPGEQETPVDWTTICKTPSWCPVLVKMAPKDFPEPHCIIVWHPQADLKH